MPNEKNRLYYNEDENDKIILQIRDSYRRGVIEQTNNQFNHEDQDLSLKTDDV